VLLYKKGKETNYADASTEWVLESLAESKQISSLESRRRNSETGTARWPDLLEEGVSIRDGEMDSSTKCTPVFKTLKTFGVSKRMQPGPVIVL